MIKDRENQEIKHELEYIRRSLSPENLKSFESKHSFNKVPRVGKIYSADRYHSALGRNLDMNV